MASRKDTLTSMDDIARIAKVSKPTVSRALKGSPLVRESTRKRIVEIARHHGYSVNWNARKLRTNRANTIAVVMHLPPQSSDSASAPFFFQLLNDINVTQQIALLRQAGARKSGWRFCLRRFRISPQSASALIPPMSRNYQHGF